jgi:hypothetical protein
MPTYESVLADLKKQFGGRVLLSPADLAPLLMVSVQGQANLRHAGTFPIPVRKVGRKVGVSVYDLASFLTGGAAQPSAAIKPVQSAAVQVAATTAKRRKGKHDWMLALRTTLEFQQELYSEVVRLGADATLQPVQQQPERKKVGL